MNTMSSASTLTQVNSSYELKTKPTVSEQAPQSAVKSTAESIAPEQSASPSSVEVDNALNVVNKAAIFEQRSLSFMVDEASGRSIVKVIDRSNDQLIRQIPSEELLKVAQDIKRLQEEMGQSLGFLVDRKV